MMAPLKIQIKFSTRPTKRINDSLKCEGSQFYWILKIKISDFFTFFVKISCKEGEREKKLLCLE